MIKEFLREMVEASGVSGYEHEVAKIIERYMTPLSDEWRKEGLGCYTALKKGYGDGKKKIMLAAHMDEIGLMVNNIDEKGFISFTNIGGVDQRTLLTQEVTVHGTEPLYGVIGSKPPHVMTPEDQKKAVPMKDMRIDVGLSKEKVSQIVSIGDVITVKRKMIELQNNILAAKAFDDRAGVAVLYECLKHLETMKHECDVYAVATTQEEVGLRGGRVSTYKIAPQIGIAVDVTFGSTPELPKDQTQEIDGGPSLTYGANIHRKVHEGLKAAAADNNIATQDEFTTGGTGTDANIMQITGCGVATAVVSIPLRYMHTSVELLSLNDIKACGKLLAHYIVSLNNKDWEELLCY